MTSYRQLQSDDVSDQFDLDSHSDGTKSREEVEVQIEPSRARTKSRVRLPNTSCTKNKVIAVLVIMLLVLILISSLTIYELDKHGVQCHSDEVQATYTPTIAAVVTTAVTAAVTTASVAVASPTPTDTNDKTFPWKSIRLPGSAIPFLYEIFLHPNLTTFDVHGNVTIHFNTTEEVSFIVMHAKDMIIHKPKSIKLEDGQSTTIPAGEMAFSKKFEQALFHFQQPIPADMHCILTLNFNYTLSNGLDGFYRSSYKKDGKSRTMASTQFEATSARQAFPCFDEPALKAIFSLKIVHDEEHITLFNMPAETRDEVYQPGDLKLDTYRTTVPMSTYLVAFVVCDFVNIKDVSSSGTEVAVYTPEAQISQADLALQVVKETIPFYEELFDIAYPLPKQDMIAIPDFSAGAMENWGLITYRESSIMYQPNITSSGQEAWIVVTITHELAHQWFGNLVTMRWWNDLWLNEGFASFVEYLGANNFRPEWHMMDKFILDTTQRAMQKDQQANSHPISVNVNDPNQISEIFDEISYSKGATILKMLQSFLMKNETDVMILGIQDYLKKFKFGNAATADLWTSISKVAKDNGNGVDVAAMMDTWTQQMGYPMISLIKKSGKVIAHQQRFLIYPMGNQPTTYVSTYSYKWTIPLTYFTDTDPTVKSVVMSSNQDLTTLNVNGYHKWFKFNSGQSGMYRVNYDDQIWTALVRQLENSHVVFTPADRANLLDDAFNLAWAGHISYMIPLDMSRYLQSETAYVSIESGLGGLSSIGAMLHGTEGYPYYKDYVMQLFSGLATQLGKEDTGEHLDRLVRQSLLATFRSLGDIETLQWASSKYTEWMDTGKLDVGPNLRGIVQCGGLQYGNQREWEFAWARYENTTSASEKATLNSVLACTQVPSLLSRYLQWSLDSSKIKQQDSDGVITAVASHPAGSYLALSFVINNWDTLMDQIGKQPFVMSSLVRGTMGWISTKMEYNMVNQFFADNDPKQARREVTQTLEDIRMRIAWRKQNEKTVTEWLKNAIA